MANKSKRLISTVLILLMAVHIMAAPVLATFVKEDETLYIDMLDGKYDKKQLYNDFKEQWPQSDSKIANRGYFYQKGEASSTNIHLEKITEETESGEAGLESGAEYIVLRGKTALNQEEIGRFIPRTYYQITAAVAPGGPEGGGVQVSSEKVYAKQSVRVEAVPVDGYDTVLSCGDERINALTHTYVPESSDAWTVTYLSKDRPTHQVELLVQGDAYGTAALSATGAQPEGTGITLTATPGKTGYLSDIQVTGVAAQIGNFEENRGKIGEFTVGTSDITVTVTFEQKKLNVRDSSEGKPLEISFNAALPNVEQLKKGIFTAAEVKGFPTTPLWSDLNYLFWLPEEDEESRGSWVALEQFLQDPVPDGPMTLRLIWSGDAQYPKVYAEATACFRESREKATIEFKDPGVIEVETESDIEDALLRFARSNSTGALQAVKLEGTLPKPGNTGTLTYQLSVTEDQNYLANTTKVKIQVKRKAAPARVRIQIKGQGQVSLGSLTADGTLDPGTYQMTATPQAGWYVFTVTVNGVSKEGNYTSYSFSTDQIIGQDRDYEVVVVFQEQKLELRERQTISFNGWMLKHRELSEDGLKTKILEAVLGEKIMDPEEYEIRQKTDAGYEPLTSQNLELERTYTLQVTRLKTDRYPEVSEEVVVTAAESRTPAVFRHSGAVYTAQTLEQVDIRPDMTVIDGAGKMTITYKSGKLATQPGGTAQITYTVVIAEGMEHTGATGEICVSVTTPDWTLENDGTMGHCDVQAMPDGTFCITVTPEDDHVLSAVTVNGQDILESRHISEDGVAQITDVALQDTENVIAVSYQKVSLTARGGVVDPWAEPKATILSMITTTVPDPLPEGSYVVEYQPFGDISAITLPGAQEYLQQYQWFPIDQVLELDGYGRELSSLCHAFGAEQEIVRIRYQSADGRLTAVSQPFTVQCQDLRAGTEIRLNRDLRVTYGSIDPDELLAALVEGVYSNGQRISDATLTLETDVSALNAGSASIVVRYPGNERYQPSQAVGTILVQPISVTVTLDDKTKVPGAPDPDWTWTTDFDTICLPGARMVVEVSREAGDACGSYPITARAYVPGAEENYTIRVVEATLTIAPKQLTATDVQLVGVLTYNGQMQTQKVTASPGITYLVTGNTGTNAGAYALTVTGTGNCSGVVTIPWAIQKATATVQIRDSSKMQGAEDPEFQYTVSGLIAGENPDIRLCREPGEAPGRYAITASGENDNYEINCHPGQLTILAEPTQVGYPIHFEDEAFPSGAEVEIDGVPYIPDENGVLYLPGTESRIAVVYSYHVGNTAHESYPTGMQVWYLQFDGSSYTAQRLPELDDLLQYQGTSIRVNFNSNGIRFFTAVPSDSLSILVAGELAGFRLIRAGTLYKKWSEGSVLTIGSGRSSDVYGGSAGDHFRVFSNDQNSAWFTGMLTGLEGDPATLSMDIQSRPFLVLERDGCQLVLYGGTIQRSIYYVATQNRDHWPQGSARDRYVEGLIASVEQAARG